MDLAFSGVDCLGPGADSVDSDVSQLCAGFSSSVSVTTRDALARRSTTRSKADQIIKENSEILEKILRKKTHPIEDQQIDGGHRPQQSPNK
jgi:hypothetical protein